EVRRRAAGLGPTTVLHVVTSRVSADSRRLLWLPAAVVAYVLGSLILPRGLPSEAVVPGLIYGGLSALTAVGLVLIYRATRVINFAQANMGAVAATLTILLIDSWHWSYWL